jgi:D-sedoheptulose 7-phosphate isomerase
MTESDPPGLIATRIRESFETTQRLLADDLVADLARAADVLVDRLRAGDKVLIFGNGGSAAEAQHIASELSGRFSMDRGSLAAVALVDSAASMTAIANDYSYEDVFARQIQGLGRPGDVAIGISTSGESDNVVRAIAAARERGMTTIGLCGERPSALSREAEICLAMPSTDTARIQECHLLAVHILCELVERELFDVTDPPD